VGESNRSTVPVGPARHGDGQAASACHWSQEYVQS